MHHVEKLLGVSNYNSWRFQMKQILVLEGLFNVIKGTDTDATRNERALARISLSVNNALVHNISSETSAKSAWEKLEKIFHDRGLYRRVLLLRKLHRMEFKSSMTDYIDNVMSIVEQLGEIGRNIDDAEIAEILLSGLPTEYDTLVSNMETLSIGSSLNSEAVRSRLLQEEHRKNGTTESSDSTYYTQSSGSSTFKKKMVCHYCKKRGHTKAKCFKRKRDEKRDGDHHSMAVTETALYARSSDFILDSGCTSHMTNNKELLRNFKMTDSKIVVANNNSMQCLGKGDLSILSHKNVKCNLTDVLYVPNLASNLLSISKITEKGHVVIFNSKDCKIMNSDGNCIATGEKVGGLFILKGSVCQVAEICSQVMKEHSASLQERVQRATSATEAAVPTRLWHRRLGHLSMKGMCSLKNSNIINFSDTELGVCVPCLEGKQAALPFPVGKAKRATQLLELIHTDVCGPMPVCSWGGARYFVTFTDDLSRKTFSYLMKNKSEVFSHFLSFKALVEKQTNLRIKCIRSDGGKEYCNDKFSKYLKDEGIVHQVTVPYTPQQNGVSERLNRTLMDKVRCMLQHSGLCQQYWGEAVMTAVYLKNRSPSDALAGRIPEEVWTGSSVDLSHLRVFGCIAYSRIPVQKRTKLDVKSKMFIFVGYSECTKGYRLCSPTDPTRITMSRDVIFLEDRFYKNDIASCDNNNCNNSYDIYNFNFNNDIYESNNSNKNNEILSEDYNNDDNQSADHNVSVISEADTADEFCTGDERDSGSESSAAPSPPQRDRHDGTLLLERSSVEGEAGQSTVGIPATVASRPIRGNRGKPPVRYDDYDLDYSMLTQNCSDPLSYHEAISGPDSSDWIHAMKREYDSLMSNTVWKLVERPQNVNIVKNKWVYRKKCNSTGELTYKARLVARGFSQKQGIDYTDTFSPVVRHSTMRILFALANNFDLDIEHLDVETAFLNSNLNEVIYMEQPDGFITDKNKVCLLLKSIYGLKQSSRMWNLKVHKLLVDNDFIQSKCEPCVYFKCLNKKITIIALYVDDFYVFSNCNDTKSKLYKLLESNFNVKNLGSLKNCLGINITRDKSKGILTLDQSAYIRKLLKIFGMEQCRPVSTPMVCNSKLEKAESADCLDDDVYKYRQLLGSLMYLSVCTRPDITFAVSQLSQFNNGFNKSHWIAAKRILRYLAGTLNYALYFHRSHDLNLVAYADADWGNDCLDRKSYTGYVIKLGTNTISWESRKQKCVALSSTEAEYLAISDTCKELCFIKNFVFEIMNVKISTTLFNDNQSAQKLLTIREFCHKKTKHIDIRYHFVKDLIVNNLIAVKYMSTDNMIADVLTKALSSTKHNKFISLIKLIDREKSMNFK